MDLFHKLQDLIDKNTAAIPENDYIEMCSTLMEIRRLVKPPGYMVDQNTPMPMPVPPPFMPTFTPPDVFRPFRALAEEARSTDEAITALFRRRYENTTSTEEEESSDDTIEEEETETEESSVSE